MRRRWSDPVWARQSTRGRTDTGSVARAIFTAALAQMGIDDLEVAERLTERYCALRLAEMRLFPGAIAALAHLRRHLKISSLVLADAPNLQGKHGGPRLWPVVRSGLTAQLGPRNNRGAYTTLER